MGMRVKFYISFHKNTSKISIRLLLQCVFSNTKAVILKFKYSFKFSLLFKKFTKPLL